MSLASTKTKRNSWKRKESYRYNRWRFHRFTTKNTKLRSKWWKLYQEARDKRVALDKEIKKIEANSLRYRLGWRSVRALVAPERNLSKVEAKALALELGEAMQQYGITSRRAAAMFLAQVAHESALFRATTEYASGAAYEGRRDLGNTQPGDGKRYRGRSYIQITGRANYRQVPHWDGINFEQQPHRLAEPKYAAKAAAWWWNSRNLTQRANEGAGVSAITRVINGGYNGLAHRISLYQRAQAAGQWLTPKRRKP